MTSHDLTVPEGVLELTTHGGLPAVVVRGPHAQAEILLQGAHVLSFIPTEGDHEGEELLWVSSTTPYEEGVAVRGGVPLCFPWFGPHPTVPDAPQHGFARRLPWELAGVVWDAGSVDGNVEVSFQLTDSDATRATVWPHPFSARLTVVVGRELTLRLAVTNTGDAEISYTTALHTYLEVPDVTAASVTGLEDAGWVDRVDVGAHSPAGTPVVFDGEVDRTYRHAGAVTLLAPPMSPVVVDPEGASDVVVWNAGPDKAARMADVGPGEWQTYACVETAVTGDAAVRLAPGETFETSVTYRRP